LSEGWQSTKTVMPAMPFGDPWESINALLAAEKLIRMRNVQQAAVDELHDYWLDLIRLLQIFRFWKDKRFSSVKGLRKKMSTEVYDAYIARREKLKESDAPLQLTLPLS
jgi:thymidylate synthase